MNFLEKIIFRGNLFGILVFCQALKQKQIIGLEDMILYFTIQKILMKQYLISKELSIDLSIWQDLIKLIQKAENILMVGVKEDILMMLLSEERQWEMFGTI